ncbi:cytochrome c oxidase subunit 4 [Streptomyces pseudogriseolus]|uniref:aa3-type cytochrome oxidase subunit IV n=1 Tax=Streptomyces pseudogriseolus TaxID=36817 RepID=UPI003FA1CFD9
MAAVDEGARMPDGAARRPAQRRQPLLRRQRHDLRTVLGRPAGTAALVVSCLMSALVAFFLWYRHRKDGLLPKDRKGASVHEAAGPVAFFPPHSAFPVLAAAGTALLGLGAVYGLWLFLIGAGVLVPGVLGFAFQYAARGTDPVRPTGVEDR